MNDFGPRAAHKRDIVCEFFGRNLNGLVISLFDVDHGRFSINRQSEPGALRSGRRDVVSEKNVNYQKEETKVIALAEIHKASKYSKAGIKTLTLKHNAIESYRTIKMISNVYKRKNI